MGSPAGVGVSGGDLGGGGLNGENHPVLVVFWL